MATKLILDTKENKLIQLLPDEPRENLDVGDIHFYKDDALVLVIERKTVADLSASIKDGRWREQKTRLFAFCKNRSQILYLIEGNLSSSKKGLLPYKTLQSSITNCIVRDGINVYKTSSIEETCDFLLYLKASIEKQPCFHLGQEPVTSVSYVDKVAKVKKKDNIDAANCFILQLACIPDISTFMAKAIAENFPTMKRLLTELECNQHTFIADIIYTSETGKERRIGPKAAQKIAEYLL